MIYDIKTQVFLKMLGYELLVYSDNSSKNLDVLHVDSAKSCL